MGYFPNGTTIQIYMDKICESCISFRKDEGPAHLPGCPILVLHMTEWGDTPERELKQIRNWFIPRKGNKNLPCRMFIEKDLQEEEDESPLYP
jgi:hypothetical protein